MNTVETAWVAGLLEADGCFFATRTGGKARRDGTRYGPYFYPRVACLMTDKDTLVRLHRTTGVGHVRGPRQHGQNKPIWEWVVSRSADAVALMLELWPFLGERRRHKIGELITEFDRPGI